VVLPWAANLGPIGIAAAVFGSRIYYKHKLQKEELASAIAMATSFIDGDIIPQINDKGIEENPRFFVISTYPTTY